MKENEKKIVLIKEQRISETNREFPTRLQLLQVCIRAEFVGSLVWQCLSVCMKDMAADRTD